MIVYLLFLNYNYLGLILWTRKNEYNTMVFLHLLKK